MNSLEPELHSTQYNVLDPAPHTLHECRTADEFRACFEATTRRSIQHVTDTLLPDTAPRAILSVGSIPLGMGTRGSDIDLIVLVDARESLLNNEKRLANSRHQASFSNEADSLVATSFLELHAGLLVDIQVALAHSIRDIYARLRRRGPELSETEVRILGRLKTGWLLWQSESYLERNCIDWTNRTLDVYCCTRNFVTALTHQRKATKALELHDVVLALQLGRGSVEMAYLAYFASEGLVYLGAKWLAQLGFARGAHERLGRHPLLRQSLHLLFPVFTATEAEAAQYLRDVGEFLRSIRGLIEQQILFRIAFKACVQIAAA
jgi:hypothetical protein